MTREFKKMTHENNTYFICLSFESYAKHSEKYHKISDDELLKTRVESVDQSPELQQLLENVSKLRRNIKEFGRDTTRPWLN